MSYSRPCNGIVYYKTIYEDNYERNEPTAIKELQAPEFGQAQIECDELSISRMFLTVTWYLCKWSGLQSYFWVYLLLTKWKNTNTN